jgi:uncharacterized protein
MRPCARKLVLQYSRKPLCRALAPKILLKSSGCRRFSWQGHGTDLLGDSLAYSAGSIPKIVLHGYGTTGVDVVNMIKNKDPSDVALQGSGGIVHMAGSILAFPGGCFLWKVRSPEDLTLESLAPILLYEPKLEYLFLGSIDAIPPATIHNLREGFAAADVAMVVEPMDVVCYGKCSIRLPLIMSVFLTLSAPATAG